MIQRLQSIYLLLAAVAFFLLFLFPFATSESPSQSIFADASYDIKDHLALLVSVILGGALAFISIFLFKNRKLQLKFGYLVILVAVLTPILVIGLYFLEKETLNGSGLISVKVGLFLPLIALIFTLLATRGISKDDKLVKSMDRLR